MMNFRMVTFFLGERVDEVVEQFFQNYFFWKLKISTRMMNGELKFSEVQDIFRVQNFLREGDIFWGLRISWDGFFLGVENFYRVRHFPKKIQKKSSLIYIIFFWASERRGAQIYFFESWEDDKDLEEGFREREILGAENFLEQIFFEDWNFQSPEFFWELRIFFRMMSFFEREILGVEISTEGDFFRMVGVSRRRWHF